MSWLIPNKNSSGKIVSWLYRYRIGKLQKERSTKCKDHAAALRMQKHWDACILLYGKFPDEMGQRATSEDGNEIKAQAERFLLHKKAEIKQTTVVRYRIQFASTLAFLESHGINKFAQLNTSLMIDYKIKRLNDGRSHKTVAEELALFRSLIRGLVEEEVLAHDPVKKWPEVAKRIPAKPDTLGPYSDQQVRQLLEHFKDNVPDFYSVAMIAFYTGMRIGEIKAMKVSDVNFDACIATICNQKSIKDTKSAFRQVTLHPELLAMLKQKCKTSLPMAFVFPELRLHAVPWPTKQIKKACSRLGIQYRRFHGCRHTFASKAANSGISLPKVQAQLGHTNLATTQRYIKNDQIDETEICMIKFV